MKCYTGVYIKRMAANGAIRSRGSLCEGKKAGWWFRDALLRIFKLSFTGWLWSKKALKHSDLGSSSSAITFHQRAADLSMTRDISLNQQTLAERAAQDNVHLYHI